MIYLWAAYPVLMGVTTNYMIPGIKNLKSQIWFLFSTHKDVLSNKLCQSQVGD